MECKYWDLGVRWDLDWVETHILRPGYVAVELGWSWGAILLTWMDVCVCVCVCVWGGGGGGGGGGDLHWDELRPGWMWDVNITPGLYNLDPPPSRWQITSIKVPKLHLSSTQYPCQCHPGLMSLQVLSHIHLGSCLNSKHVSSDFHHGP